MKFGTIASGSSGNCLFCASKNTNILIDAGISYKRICNGLDDFDIDAQSIQGILITHEHIDHVLGLGVLSRKLGIPIYGTERTLEAIMNMSKLGKIDMGLYCPIVPGEKFCIGDLEIEPFSIPHDAADPVSYVVRNHNSKLGMVTDLGHYDEEIVDYLKQSNFLYIEANHDIHMLQAGSYPYVLKKRILGDYGHICNEMAAELILELMHDELKQVILGHLSKENNYPELALATIYNEIKGAVDVQVAPRDCAGPLFDF